jgi:hypothetical protein
MDESRGNQEMLNNTVNISVELIRTKVQEILREKITDHQLRNRRNRAVRLVRFPTRSNSVCLVIHLFLKSRLSDEMFNDCFKDVCDELDCLNTNITNSLLDAEFTN